MNFEYIYAEARAAGLAAGKAAVPPVMVVQERASALDDESPVKKEWTVPEGPCGFAWVNVRPGNSKFANWLKKNGLARSDSYAGGVTIWVSEFGQSMVRKEAYARALAESLRGSLGMDRIYADSRMD